MVAARSYDQTSPSTTDSAAGARGRVESYNTMLQTPVLKDASDEPNQPGGQVATLPIVRAFVAPEHTLDRGHTLTRPPAQEARSLEIFLLQREQIDHLFQE